MTIQIARDKTQVVRRYVRILLVGCVAAGILLFAGALLANERELPRDLVLPKGVEIASLLLSPETVVSLGAAFDVDPDGLPAIAQGSSIRVIGAQRQLIELRPEDWFKTHLEGDLAIRDFAWMRDGTLLFVIHNVLVTPDPYIQFPVIKYSNFGNVELPSVGMHVRPAGDNTAYVFGAMKESDNHAVYLLSRNKSFAKLLTLPAPIADVAGDGATSFVAVGNTVLRVAEIEVVKAVLQTPEDIVSLARTPAGGFFYASKSGIGYVAANGAAYEFMRGETGVLRVRGASLYVRAREGSRVLRISPVEPFEQLLKGPN